MTDTERRAIELLCEVYESDLLYGELERAVDDFLEKNAEKLDPSSRWYTYRPRKEIPPPGSPNGGG